MNSITPNLFVPNSHASNSDFEFAALGEAKRYRQALIAVFSRELRGDVLEIGAGIGQLTAGIKVLPMVTSVTAVEPDPKFHGALQQELPSAQIVKGTADQVDPARTWDCVMSVNVLEHIENDQEELVLYRRLLAARSGTICLFVPARPEIYSSIDRDFGHFRRYRKNELREKLERAGFEITTLRYYNFAGYFAWWLTFCLMRRRHFNPFAVRCFDRFVFPSVFWYETHIFPPLIGQSLLAVAHPTPGRHLAQIENIR